MIPCYRAPGTCVSSTGGDALGFTVQRPARDNAIELEVLSSQSNFASGRPLKAGLEVAMEPDKSRGGHF